ncbi:amino acid adenylation domain-containing protein [Nonomuraea sp. NPDC050556]|uniref:amino acid adenylation domain-containing protein n=1 Tax=Nonomuraea sp. NPDC050556 TaxID=3364369 RepID=UPI003795196B
MTLQTRLAAARRTVAATGIPATTSGDGDVPMSPAQARLWFVWRLEPDSPAYNLPIALRLRGELDVGALVGAVEEVARRHRVLRSVFVEENGRLLTRLVPPCVVSFSSDTATERPFALDREPPMRAVLHQVGPEEHVLALTFHHIAMDARSLTVVLNELAALYGGAVLPPPLQYADVAAWEARRGDDGGLEWWRERLAGLAPVLDLPTDRPRPVVADWAAGEVPVTVPGVLSAAERLGCTPFMVLLAGWQILLGRLADVDDVAVGVPTSGRYHPDMADVVGCFINTLVMRTDVRDGVEGVRDTVLDAFGHGNTPFERIVEALQPERGLSTTPIFQVMLNVVDDLASAAIPGLDVEEIPLPGTRTKYDLNLGLARTGEVYAGALTYRADLFDHATAERVVGWYLTVMDHLVRDEPLDTLEPVTGPALAGPPIDDEPLPPVHRLIERWASSNATAVVGPAGSLTYNQLERRANRIAHRLIGLGVTADEPVGVLLESGTDLVCALLGIFKSGGGYLPLDSVYPTERIAAMLAAAGVRAVLTERSLADRLDRSAHSIVVLDALDDVRDTRPDVDVRPEHLSHVIFTSGSTGVPKAVAGEHRNISRYLDGMMRRLGPVDGRTFAVVSTPAADFGLTCVFGALTTGGTVHLVSREVAMDPEAFAAYNAEHGIDVLKCVPSHLELLAAHGDLAAVLPRELLIVAGEACPWSLVDRVRTARPGLRMQSHYGHTESTMIAMTCDVDEVTPSALVPLGEPLPGVVGYLVDRAGRPVPPGLPGELVIGGPGITRGYLNDPVRTAERFTGEPRCYRSGDVLRVRPDGTVEFRGRTDDQVKIRGHRVELGEVTVALLAHPLVREAVVLPTGEGHERVLTAWLVTSPGADVAEIRRHLRKGLPDHMVPAGIVVLERLPLNPNGKIDRAALPRPAAAAAAPPGPLGTVTEYLVASAWAEVLGVALPGPGDDFFALGGHSFAAVRVMGRLGAPVRLIFEHPVLADLAAALGRAGGSGSEPIPRRPDGPVELSPAQARLWFLSQLDPSGSAYNVGMTLRLTGPLDVAALAGAVRDVALRHDVLRSVFLEDGVRLVDPAPVALVCPVDLAAEVAAETARPFALETEPPMRAVLFHVGPEEHVLALTFHHIAIDNWSRGLIGDDLAAFYGGAEPSPPPLQYADVAHWEASSSGEDVEWWCERLAGLPPLLELPTDRPRPVVADWTAGEAAVSVPAAGVRDLARRLGCTPFMVLLAGWQILLGRLAEVGDVAVGVPESGRHHPDMNDVVGCFINTLVMRTDLTGNPTGAEVVGRVRETVLGAFGHARTPFERIVEAVQPERGLSSTPIFQVMLNVLEEPAASPALAGVEVELLEPPVSSVKFDLNLGLVAAGDSYEGALLYRADLFDASTIAQMLDSYTAILADLSGDPSRPIGVLQPPLAAQAVAVVPVEPVAPSTPTQRRIADVWADVLRIPVPALDDDFFALGGHSFAAVRAVRAIGGDLRVIDLFMHPTLRELAHFIDGPSSAGGLLHRLGGPRQAATRLVCVPYGGGSAAVFRPLADALSGQSVEVLAVELPGHDPARAGEELVPIDALADRLAAEIGPGAPVLLYGHCVGSALATALGQRLEAAGVPLSGVIVAGSFPTAPLPGRISSWVRQAFPRSRWVSDRLFRDTLRATGGLLDDMDEATTDTVLRALRHDSEEAQAWFGAWLSAPGERLRAPVLCLVGESDLQTRMYEERYQEWAAFAENVSLATIPRAGHYFIRHQPLDIAAAITAFPPSTEPVPPPARQSLRPFYTVAAGQFVSMMGSALSSFALGVWAYQRSGRIMDLALVVMLAQLPAILLTPLGGAVADRFDRRRVMLAADAVAGVAMAALPVLMLTDSLSIPAICAIVGLTSMATAFHAPAYLAAIAQLVPKPYLPQANALAQIGVGAGTVFGPLAGGALIVAVGLPGVVTIDVLSFAAGVLTLLAVRFPDRLFLRREEPFRKALSGGWRFLSQRPPLMVMIAYFAVVNYFTAMMWIALPPLVLTQSTPTALGVVEAVGGCGAIAGAVVAIVWGGSERRATGMLACVIGSGIGVILMGAQPTIWLIAAGLFTRLAFMSLGNAHWLSIIQTKVGHELQGRVLAINMMCAAIMQPLGFLTTPGLANAFGVGPLLAASGVFLVIWGIAGLRYRRLHHLEDELPDTTPPAEWDPIHRTPSSGRDKLVG